MSSEDEALNNIFDGDDNPEDPELTIQRADQVEPLTRVVDADSLPFEEILNKLTILNNNIEQLQKDVARYNEQNKVSHRKLKDEQTGLIKAINVLTSQEQSSTHANGSKPSRLYKRLTDRDRSEPLTNDRRDRRYNPDQQKVGWESVGNGNPYERVLAEDYPELWRDVEEGLEHSRGHTVTVGDHYYWLGNRDPIYIMRRKSTPRRGQRR